MTTLEEIEVFVADEATIELSELCGPNSLEFDLELDNFIDAKLCSFHAALFTSIYTEMFANV